MPDKGNQNTKGKLKTFTSFRLGYKLKLTRPFFVSVNLERILTTHTQSLDTSPTGITLIRLCDNINTFSH